MGDAGVYPQERNGHFHQWSEAGRDEEEETGESDGRFEDRDEVDGVKSQGLEIRNQGAGIGDHDRSGIAESSADLNDVILLEQPDGCYPGRSGFETRFRIF